MQVARSPPSERLQNTIRNKLFGYRSKIYARNRYGPHAGESVQPLLTDFLKFFHCLGLIKRPEFPTGGDSGMQRKPFSDGDRLRPNPMNCVVYRCRINMSITLDLFYFQIEAR